MLGHLVDSACFGMGRNTLFLNVPFDVVGRNTLCVILAHTYRVNRDFWRSHIGLVSLWYRSLFENPHSYAQGGRTYVYGSFANIPPRTRCPVFQAVQAGSVFQRNFFGPELGI